MGKCLFSCPLIIPIQSVGWVERSETHHLRGFVMGFASSTHPTRYALRTSAHPMISASYRVTCYCICLKKDSKSYTGKKTKHSVGMVEGTVPNTLLLTGNTLVREHLDIDEQRPINT